MNKKERLKVLLERGFFPEELPPPFHTSDFAKYRAFVGKKWPNNDQYPQTRHEIYSIPRVKNARRNLSIVNPICQYYVAKIISDNWVAIENFFTKSKYSLSIPKLVETESRAIPKLNFSEIARSRNAIDASYDFGLSTDISRFYGTLYTHAIPWALHGKAWSKANLHAPAFKTSLGNRLDIAIRKGQENQTLGIPLGPDTSRIVSEIIGVAIDIHVQTKLGLEHDNSFRYVDDWFIGLDSMGETEVAISALASACAVYELELNAQKTVANKVADTSDGGWVTDLRQYTFKSDKKGQADTLEKYFLTAFSYANENPNQNILDYAIKRTRSIKVMKENWSGYELFLLKCARSSPIVIPAVVQIMVTYNYEGYNLDKKKIKKLIHDQIKRSAPLAHHAEVAWSLFLAKALHIDLESDVAVIVSNLESSVCALLALDLEQRGLIPSGLNKSLWIQSMSANGLQSSAWLLAYEADLKGWIASPTPNFVENHTLFSHLKAKKISFYDINKNVAHVARPLRRRAAASSSQFFGDATLDPATSQLLGILSIIP